MDDETRQYFDKLAAQIEGVDSRLSARMEALDQRMEALDQRMEALDQRMESIIGGVNDQVERVLDALSAIRHDHDTTRGYVLYGLQDNLTLSQRISKLEDEMRKR